MELRHIEKSKSKAARLLGEQFDQNALSQKVTVAGETRAQEVPLTSVACAPPKPHAIFKAYTIFVALCMVMLLSFHCIN